MRLATSKCESRRAAWPAAVHRGLEGAAGATMLAWEGRDVVEAVAAERPMAASRHREQPASHPVEHHLR